MREVQAFARRVDGCGSDLQMYPRILFHRIHPFDNFVFFVLLRSY